MRPECGLSLHHDQFVERFVGEIQQNAGVTDFDSTIERDQVFAI